MLAYHFWNKFLIFGRLSEVCGEVTHRTRLQRLDASLLHRPCRYHALGQSLSEVRAVGRHRWGSLHALNLGGNARSVGSLPGGVLCRVQHDLPGRKPD